MLSIAVIEDNDELRQTMVDTLFDLGHRALGFDSAEALVEHGDSTVLDVALVDVNLPGEDGLSLVRRLRQVQPATGVIMITGRAAPADRVAGYQSGADIYLQKPVSPQELEAALVALTRRLAPPAPPEGLSVDLSRLLLVGPAGTVAITQPEATLLAAFARAPERRLETWQILEIFDQLGWAFTRGNLSVTIFRLGARLKMAGAPAPPIRAIRNWGYRLVVPLALSG